MNPLCALVQKLAFVFGCMEPKQYPARKVDAKQITDQLPGAEDVELFDKDYYAWDFQSLLDFLSKDWTSAKHYVPESFDCDDFALLYAAHARLKGTNVVGRVIDATLVHAYNVHGTFMPSGEFVLWVVEPQANIILGKASVYLRGHKYHVIF